MVDIRGMVVSMVVLALLLVLVLVVVDPRSHRPIIMHVRGEEDRVGSTLLQHIQRRHLRCREAIDIQILCPRTRVQISELA